MRILKYNKVTLRQTNSNEYTIDFFHPIKSKGRVRRKLKMDVFKAQKIQTALEFFNSNEIYHSYSSKNIAKNSLLEDDIYRIENPEIIDLILDIYYKHHDEFIHEAFINYNKYLPLPTIGMKTLLLGNSKEKSMFIEYLTQLHYPICGDYEQQTYNKEFIVNENMNNVFKIYAKLMPFEIFKEKISFMVNEAVEKSIDFFAKEKLYDYTLYENKLAENYKDNCKNILSPFMSNIKHFLDYTDKNYSHDNPWHIIYNSIVDIYFHVLKYNLPDDILVEEAPEAFHVNFIKSKFYRYVDQCDESTNCEYNKLIDYICKKIMNCIYDTKNLIEGTMPTKFNVSSDENWCTEIYVEFNSENIERYSNLFNIFGLRFSVDNPILNTTKCNKLDTLDLSLVISKLRVGVPCKAHSPRKPILLVDRGNISSRCDSISSIENSINLKLSQYDVIHFCMDMSTPMNDTIKSIYKQGNKNKILISNIEYDDKNKNVSISLNNMEDIYGKSQFLNHSSTSIKKIKKNRPLVSYDYKKLSIMYYLNISDTFIKELHKSIFSSKVDNKSIKSLIFNLMNGTPYFNSNITLNPLDDLYSIFIDNLYDYIFNPSSINFANHDDSLSKDMILEMLKEKVFHKISELIIEEFINPYTINALGAIYEINDFISSDKRRRKELLNWFENILTNIYDYMNDVTSHNWVDNIEKIFIESIDEIENVFL